MKTISGIIIGLLLGGAAGLWAGVNIGRDVPITSNPFKEQTASQKFSDKASRFYDKTRDAFNEEFK